MSATLCELYRCGDDCKGIGKQLYIIVYNDFECRSQLICDTCIRNNARYLSKAVLYLVAPSSPIKISAFV